MFKRRIGEIIKGYQSQRGEDIKARTELKKHTVLLPDNLEKEQPIAKLEKQLDTPNLKQEFPTTILIEREGLRPDIERIPTFARMDKINGNELIWLTPDAVEERLNIVLHTNPEFSEKQPIVAKLYQHSVDRSTDEPVLSTMESGVRKPVDSQTVIDIFQKNGFQIVQNENGEKFIMIDATIPASENMNGRYEQRSIGTRQKDGITAEGSIYIPHGFSSAGFRPATKDSTHAIAIPVPKLLELHNERLPISSFYFRSDQAESKSDDLLIHRNGGYPDIIKNISKTFQKLSKDPDIGEKIKQFTYAKSAEERHLQKIQLYKLLTETLQLKNYFIFNSGYFPYEPAFRFAYPALQFVPINLEAYKNPPFEQLGVKYLQEINNFDKKQLPGHPGTEPYLLLDEILSVVYITANKSIVWKEE